MTLRSWISGSFQVSRKNSGGLWCSGIDRSCCWPESEPPPRSAELSSSRRFGNGCHLQEVVQAIDLEQPQRQQLRGPEVVWHEVGRIAVDPVAVRHVVDIGVDREARGR